MKKLKNSAEQEKALLATKAELLKQKFSSMTVKMKEVKKSKLKAQKVASKWRRKKQTEEHQESCLVEKLNNEVIQLEEENETLHDKIQSFLEGEEITAFKDGKYVDEVREVYCSLISKGIPVTYRKCHMHCSKKNLGGKYIGQLPKKSLSAEMMVECELLAKMQVGNMLLEGESNTLHLDGT